MAVRRLLLVLVTVATLAGCSEDPAAPERVDTTLSGTVIRVDDEAPMAGLEVTLFDPVMHVDLARAVTDSAGRFAFGDVSPGSRIPVVHSTLYRPVFLPRALWLVEEGDQIDVTIRMRKVSGMAGAAEITLRGRVLDQETLEPIANARVEMNFLGNLEVAEVNWSEYSGWSSDLETTTDADGRYVLSPVPVFLDVLSERLNTPDHRVVAPGYRAKVMRRIYDPSGTDIAISAAKLVRGEDTGTISGRVVDRFGAPMAGVPVSAEWRRVDNLLRGLDPTGDLAFPDRIIIPGETPVTDADGRFVIAGLPDGYFVVMAGPGPDDGFVGVPLTNVQVPGIEVTLEGFGVVAPVSPLEGEVLPTVPAELVWEAVADAVRYDVRLTRASDGARGIIESDGPSLPCDRDPEFFGGPDSYVWEVLAIDANGNGIRRTDRPLVFHVIDR